MEEDRKFEKLNDFKGGITGVLTGRVRVDEVTIRNGKRRHTLTFSVGGSQEKNIQSLWVNVDVPDEISYEPFKGQEVEVKGFILPDGKSVKMYIDGYIKYYEGNWDKFKKFDHKYVKRVKENKK